MEEGREVQNCDSLFALLDTKALPERDLPHLKENKLFPFRVYSFSKVWSWVEGAAGQKLKYLQSP